MLQSHPTGQFPTASAILLGLGLGGFFDGIVFHQLLQWHHMVSSWYPPATVDNLRVNTLWDGIFHSATYVLVVLAVYLLWKRASAAPLYWSGKLIAGTILLGWGCFNVVEGAIDHHLLGIHHVNELVGAAQRGAWDVGFLLWGGLMIAVGWLVRRAGRAEHAVRAHGAARAP